MLFLTALCLLRCAAVELSSLGISAGEGREVSQAAGEEVTSPVVRPLLEAGTSFVPVEITEGQAFVSAPQAEPQAGGVPVIESGINAIIEALSVVEAVEMATGSPTFLVPEAVEVDPMAVVEHLDILVQPQGVEDSSVAMMRPLEGNHFPL